MIAEATVGETPERIALRARDSLPPRLPQTAEKAPDQGLSRWSEPVSIR